MKKLRNTMVIVLSIVMLLLCGCGGTQATQTPESSATDMDATEDTLSPVEYPTQPIKLIVPNKPGGGLDTLNRLIAKYIDLPEELVVTNMEGASGSIATAELMSSESDGHTVLAQALTMILNCQAGVYDGQNMLDMLEPVCIYADEIIIIIAEKDAPFDTLDEFAEYAKANPNTISLGVAGAKGTGHAALLGVANHYDIIDDLNFVVFGGAAEAKSNLLGNNVQVTAFAASEAGELLRSGDVKALALCSEERDPAFPDVPTTYEQGVELTVNNWRGFFVPKGTPDEIIDIFAGAVEKVTENPEYLAEMDARGSRVNFRGPEETVEQIKTDEETFAPLSELFKEME